MKKISFVLAIFALIFMIGCGSSKTDDSSRNRDDVENSCTQGTYKCSKKNDTEISKYCSDGQHWESETCESGCDEETGQCFNGCKKLYDCLQDCEHRNYRRDGGSDNADSEYDGGSDYNDGNDSEYDGSDNSDSDDGSNGSEKSCSDSCYDNASQSARNDYYALSDCKDDWEDAYYYEETSMTVEQYCSEKYKKCGMGGDANNGGNGGNNGGNNGGDNSDNITCTPAVYSADDYECEYKICTEDSRKWYEYDGKKYYCDYDEDGYSDCYEAEDSVLYDCYEKNGNTEEPDEPYEWEDNDPEDSCTWIDGYMWSSKAPYSMNWYDAVDYCENLYECGYSDWYLPSITELRTLIKNCSYTETYGECEVTNSCLYDSCCNEVCDGCSADSSGYYSKLGDTDRFWSSSLQSDDTDSAWRINFYYGDIYTAGTDEDDKYVRCMR